MRKGVKWAAIVAAACLVACSGNGGRSTGTRFVPLNGPPAVPASRHNASGPVIKNTNDSGPGSLRQAVADAQPGDTIKYTGPKPATIVLTSGPVTLSKNLTVAGPGQKKLAISGNGTSQVFIVTAATTVTLSGLTMEQGVAAGSQPNGGAIYNAGTLGLNNDLLLGNSASSPKRHARRQRPPIVPTRFDPRPHRGDRRPPRHPRVTRLPTPDQPTSGQGGAVYNAGSLIVAGSTFSGNNVQEGSGGAIYNASGATLSATSTAFDKNSAAYGGALDNAGTATLSAVTFAQNTGWPGSGSPLSGGWGYGAAIYANGDLTVGNSTFTANIVGGNSQQSFGAGGAIAQYGGSLTLTGNHFTNNLAGGGSNGSFGYGGALYYDVAGSPPAISGNTFKHNQAGGDAFGYGGAVFAEETLSSSNDAFVQNSAFGSASGGYGYAGAIYADGGVSLGGSSFTSNTATGGQSGYAFAGAVDSEQGAALTSVTFTSNSATGGSGGTGEGGAFYLDDPSDTSTWNTVTFAKNTCGASGSYAYAVGGGATLFGAVTMSAVAFSNNSAKVAGSGALAGLGGALAMEVGPLSFTGKAMGNSASTQGGALWIDDIAAIANTTLSGDKVTSTQNPNDGGGAIYNAIGGVLTLTASVVYGNTVGSSATAGGGGGIFNEGSVSIINSTITSNSSAANGGGFENDASGGVAMTNVTLYQNAVVSGNGGNIKNLYSDAIMTLANTIVGLGRAPASNGPDISNDGKIKSQDYNLISTPPVGNALTGLVANNLQGDPMLSALGSNGGPTKTNAETSASPGLQWIPYTPSSSSCGNAAGITTDQRGDARNTNGKCDIGAYEDQTSQR